MIARNSLTTDTPETLIVGLAHKAGRTAITAALRLINGDIEGDVAEMVNGDVWQTLAMALDDLRIVRAKHIVIMTSCLEVYDFFQKPIYVKQVETKKVWVGREVFNVKVGDND